MVLRFNKMVTEIASWCMYMYMYIQYSAVLLCFVVCMTLLASIFLPSHLSLNMYMHVHVHCTRLECEHNS